MKNQLDFSTRKSLRLFGLSLLSATLLVGCAEKGPSLHPVVGKVDAGPAASKLTGSSVEVALSSDRTVRGFGQIGPDGQFHLESLQGGALREGIPEGTYVARILPNDEDGQTRRTAMEAIAPRYLKFDTSGLSVQAPATGEVNLKLSR